MSHRAPPGYPSPSTRYGSTNRVDFGGRSRPAARWRMVGLSTAGGRKTTTSAAPSHAETTSSSTKRARRGRPFERALAPAHSPEREPPAGPRPR